MLKQGKSKKTFKHNVEVEMKSGKPQDQALAIAYSIKRKAGPKKMAAGGMVDEKHLMSELPPQDETEHFDSITDAIRHKMNLKKMAEGGMIDEDDSYLEEGQVDIDDNAQEIPNQYYKANEAALKENYSEKLNDMNQPKDSNLMGGLSGQGRF